MGLTSFSKTSTAINRTKVSSFTSLTRGTGLTKTFHFARIMEFSCVQKRIHLSGFLRGGADKDIRRVFQASEKIHIVK